MRFAAAVVTLLAAAPAYAGGIGPLVMGGFHTERVYYYSNRVDGGAGPNIQDPGEWEQYQQTQIIGNAGAGLELVLGDREDLIQGVFRGYWMMDTPQVNPSNNSELVDASALVAAWREETKHTGVGTVGMQWGVLRAASDKFKFGISAHVGAGFLTRERNEFLLAQAGANVGYLVTRTLEVYGDLTYGLRVRKELSHGTYLTAGLRVMFD